MYKLFVLFVVLSSAYACSDDGSCKKYIQKKSLYCQMNLVQQFCPVLCGKCSGGITTTTKSPSGCTDDRICSKYTRSKSRYCKFEWWKNNCKSLCGLCSGVTDPPTNPPPTGSGGGSSGNLEKQCVDAHNKFRRRHQDTPDAVWDAALSRSAQKWADYLITTGGIHHSRGKYGENLYWSRGFRTAKKDGAADTAAQSWYDEIKAYDFRTGRSTGGLIGHFTQMVWTTSTKVGCGIATRGKETVVAAQYLEQGNWMGRNTQFVKPLNGRGPVTQSPNTPRITNAPTQFPSPSPTNGGGSGGLGNLEKQCVDAHNKFRRRHRNTPDAVWDAALSRSAQKWADYLITTGGIHHSRGKYGENLYWSRGFRTAKKDGAAETAAQSWYDEIKAYDFRTGRSTGGLIGHFTQMVWTTSTKVGCGIATRGKETVVAAQYLEQGNWMGRNTQFVKPLN